MPPKSSMGALSRVWKCHKCCQRTFATSARHLQVGPEHPRYIDIPEPPQQTLPYLPPVKGVLPVPRNVFSGARGQNKAADEEIEKAAATPKRERRAPAGTREEWKIKMSEARRRNLREGLKGLEHRQKTKRLEMQDARERRASQRKEILNRPERDDERFTAPSHNLDLKKLFSGGLEDPNRETRLARMKSNVAQKELRDQTNRVDSMHTLYMHARSFIVTPEQLDAAIDEAFGTTDEPVRFESNDYGTTDQDNNSMWAKGAPLSVQDMLSRATQSNRDRDGRRAMDGLSGHGAINKERIRRIAEGLTGGKMNEEGQ